MHNANTPERLQAPEMMVAGDDQVGTAGHRTFQNAVIIIVFNNRFKGLGGADNLSDLCQQFEVGDDFAFRPLGLVAQHFADFPEYGRRNWQRVLTKHGLLPNPGRF